MSKGFNIPLENNKKRIVIVGGGFAGLKLARKINDSDFQVVLIDKNNFHQFQPLFYQVSTAGLEPSAIAFPFRKIFQKRRDFHFRTAAALKVNPEKNELETSIGPINYDYLVISTGCDTNYFGNQKLKESTMPLKSISEALYARNVILNNWEEALNEDNHTAQEKDLSVVIVGGGPTGVELAGTIAEMKKFILPKDYPELDFHDMKIYLVEATDRLLNNMAPFASKYAQKELEKLGVICMTETFVQAYEDEKIILKDKEPIPTKNVLWVAGVAANSLQGLSADSYGAGNRIIVNEFNQVKNAQNIFVLGDTALMMSEKFPKGHPQVAPVAIQQAELLAKNIKAIKKNKPLRPFKYVNKGVMATVGRNKAIVDLPFLKLTGFFAWAIWLFVHLMSIVGSKNRLLIFIGWSMNYFTRDPSLRVLIKPKVK